MRLRSCCLVVVFVLLLAGAALAADPCRFIILGDIRPPLGNQDAVTPSSGYQRAIMEVNLLQPDFVVIGGDLVRGYTTPERMEQQWEAFDEATKRFRMPVYLVVGNHDVFNQTSEQFYQRRYGKLWYSVDVKGSHLVVLDSEDQSAPGKIAGAQLEWLTADLAAAKGKRIFVVLHKPLWPREEGGFRTSDWGQNVHPRLVQAGVDTVFAGHEHIYEMTPTRDGVRYIITGGGGAELGAQEQPAAGGFLHYVMVTALSDRPASLAVIHTGGVDPEDIVTTEKARLVRQFLDQFRVGSVLVEDRPVHQTVSFKVSNPLTYVVTGRLRFDAARGWTATPPAADFSLPPLGTATLRFNLIADPAQVTGALPYQIQYSATGLGSGTSRKKVGLLRTIFAAPMAVTLDGSLAEWTGPAPLVLDSTDQLWDDANLWQGQDSFSARAWLGRDRDYLYVAVAVKEAQFTPTPSGAGSASGDSVALYIDGRERRDVGRRAYGPGVAQIILAPGDSGQPVQLFLPRQQGRGYVGIQAVSQRTADGYAMEIAVPLSAFPRHSKLLGFDLSVTENSDPNHPVVLFWHGSNTNWKDASMFGRVRLAR